MKTVNFPQVGHDSLKERISALNRVINVTLTKLKEHKLATHVVANRQSRARSSFFKIFSIIKNDFIAFYIKLITYFCTSPVKRPTPSQINFN